MGPEPGFLSDYTCRRTQSPDGGGATKETRTRLAPSGWTNQLGTQPKARLWKTTSSQKSDETPSSGEMPVPASAREEGTPGKDHPSALLGLRHFNVGSLHAFLMIFSTYVVLLALSPV